MSRIVLKVDVDTYLGTRDGVPRLLALFAKTNIKATFLFSLGPDHTGRALKRLFRPGFLAKVRRTKVVNHYPLKTLLYGTLLPGPDIGKRCADIMQQTHADGHECGVHAWDHVVWQDGVMQASDEWTHKHMQKAHQRFGDIFGFPPKVHGVAGWQMNAAAIRHLQYLGYQVASDGRAHDAASADAFWPLINGELIRVPQLPTTLPTLDELLGLNGLTEANVAEHLLTLSNDGKDHVFTLHAELEGAALMPVLTQLIEQWTAQGHEFVTLGDLATLKQTQPLPYRELAWQEIPGRSGSLLTSSSKEYA